MSNGIYILLVDYSCFVSIYISIMPLNIKYFRGKGIQILLEPIISKNISLLEIFQDPIFVLDKSQQTGIKKEVSLCANWIVCLEQKLYKNQSSVHKNRIFFAWPEDLKAFSSFSIDLPEKDLYSTQLFTKKRKMLSMTVAFI